MKKTFTLSFAIGFTILGISWLAQIPLAPTTAAQQPRVPNAEYVGAMVCADCHVTEFTQFTKTTHAKARWDESKYATGCETCHGPGKAHVDGMRAAQGDDDKIRAAMNLIFRFDASPKENSSRCLTCHVTTHEQALFDRSEHKLQGVDCQTCHSPHLTEAARGARAEPMRVQGQFLTVIEKDQESDWLNHKLLRKPQPELCFNCHNVIKGQFALPTHHKVPEGLMRCTDCHNAHGTRNQPMLRRTNWEACVSCHQEKRGPFVFEHAVVKVEGCATCHSPHGSVNRNLLLRREGRFMCLQCHVDPQAPNVPHGRLGFATRGECVRCHSRIHGSNFSEFFLN